MADDCSFQILLARQIASYAYGDLNPMVKSEFGMKYNELTTYQTVQLKRAYHSTESSVAGSGQGGMKALVLYAWKEKVYLSSGPQMRVHVKAVIPEQNDVPLPSALATDNDPHDKCADWSIINLYPTFIAENEDLPLPKPADIIKVDFGNRSQHRDPVYLSLISSTVLINEDNLINRNKVGKDCKDALNKDMDKVDDHKTAPETSIGPAPPAPKEKPPPDPNKKPFIGVYIPPYYKKYAKKNRETGFWTPDWIEKVANAGVNYVSFKLNGTTAAKNGTMITDTYTKDLTGRTVKEEIAHVLKVGQAINPEFEVHAWGQSGIQRHGSGKVEHGNIQRPRNEKEAQEMAIREAQAVGQRMNTLGLSEYHFGPLTSGVQGYPGHVGFSVNPLPGRRTGENSMAINDYAVSTFSNELRKQVPGVRIWYNGFIECISQSVLMQYFDIVEPQSWPCNASAVRKKLDGKHVGAPDGRPMLPVAMEVSWTIPDGHRGTYTGSRSSTWSALKEKITEHKSRIYGVHIFNMTSQLHQSLDGWPSIPDMVKQLREVYNKT
jgi:hypothetical protein